MTSRRPLETNDQSPIVNDAPTKTTSSGKPVLELRRVSQRFGSQTVLQDISIKCHRGETLVLIGESGCGKSVTTKLFAGLLSPTQGEVRWDDRLVQDLSSNDLHRQRLRFGYLFQGAALFDSMDVYENVAFGLRQNTRLTHAEIREIVIERLREVGLSESVADKRPSDLSGGMKKRVGMARALAMSPDVMFFDEPTTGLDPVMSDVINELILQTQARRNVTSVVVTHDMHTVRRVADRIVMLYPLPRLEPGQPQIIYDGSPEGAFSSSDPRIGEFVRGEAGARLKELFAA